ICALSGMEAGAACPTRGTEWLPRDGEHETCTWHHITDRGLVTAWPEVYHDWARRQGIAVAPLPAGVDRVAADAARHARDTSARAARPDAPRGLTIVAPIAGAVFLVDPTLRPEFQMLSLRASGGTGRLRWWVDGAPLA